MPPHDPRIGYVLEVYPRFTETCVVEEILAHERAGTDIEIFSLRTPVEGRFHETLAQVRARVTYLPSGSPAADLWADLTAAASVLPGLFTALEEAAGEDSDDVHQAVLLARAVREREIEHLHARSGAVAATVARLAARLAGVPYTSGARAHDARGPVSDGLDLLRFPYADPDDREPLIVAVGSLVEHKGFGDLVQACADLAARGRPFSCEIVGAGPLEQDLRRQIDALGLGGRVSLVGPRSRDRIVGLLRSGAVFAAPSVGEQDGHPDALPTALLEAMALGTPCVATPVGGIAEALENGSAGLLVAKRDPAGLADALERLLADREVAVRLARAARARVEERFDVDCNAAEMRRMLWMPSTGHEGRHLDVPRPHEASPGGLPAGRRAGGRGGPSARRGPMIGEAAA